MVNFGDRENATQVEVITATLEQEPILANLLDLYARELGPLFGLKLPESGRFIYPDLPFYWTDPLRHPFLAQAGGELAGFALVRRTSGLGSEAQVWDMAEFFVMRSFRNQGIGAMVAHEVWRHFPGPWEIRVLRSNGTALRFWEQATKAYAPDRVKAEHYSRDGRDWVLLSFPSGITEGER